MENILFGFCILSFLIMLRIEGDCLLPDDLRGTWYSAHKGDLHFTNTSISNYSITLSSDVHEATFVCDHYNGQNVIFRIKESIDIFSQKWTAYLCLSFSKLSSNSYYYTINTALDMTTLQYIAVYKESETIADEAICNKNHSDPSWEFVMLIKTGSDVTEVMSTCPETTLRTFSNTTIMSNVSEVRCTGFETDGCNVPGLLMINDTSCPDQVKMSNEGNLVCVHHVISGNTTYLALWNSNSSDLSNQIYCYAITETSDATFVTEYPGVCHHLKTSSSVPSPGLYITFGNITQSCGLNIETTRTTPLFLSTEVPRDENDQSEVNISSIITGTLGGVILFIALTILIYTCYRCCKERKANTADKTEKIDVGYSEHRIRESSKTLKNSSYREKNRKNSGGSSDSSAFEPEQKTSSERSFTEHNSGVATFIAPSTEGNSNKSINNDHPRVVDDLTYKTSTQRSKEDVTYAGITCVPSNVKPTAKIESRKRKPSYSEPSDDIRLKNTPDLINELPDFNAFVNNLQTKDKNNFKTFEPLFIEIKEISMGAEQSNETVAKDASVAHEPNVLTDNEGNGSEKENEGEDIQIVHLDDDEPLDAGADTSGVGTSVYTDASMSLDNVDTSRTGYHSEMDLNIRANASSPDNTDIERNRLNCALSFNMLQSGQDREITPNTETVEPKYYMEANSGITPRRKSMDKISEDSPRKSLNSTSFKVEVSRSVQTDRISAVTKHFRYEPGLRVIKPTPSYLRNGDLLNDKLLKKLEGNMDKSIFDLHKERDKKRDTNIIMSGKDMAKYNPDFPVTSETGKSDFRDDYVKTIDTKLNEKHDNKENTDSKHNRGTSRRFPIQIMRPFQPYSPIPEERSFHSGIESNMAEVPSVISGFEMARYNPPGIFSTVPRRKPKKDPRLFQDTMVSSDFVWCSGTVYREYKPSFYGNHQKRQSSYRETNPLSWRSQYRASSVPWR